MKNIVNEISDGLRKRNASSAYINSFKLKRMVFETLNQFVDMNRLHSYNNIYVPNPSNNKKQPTVVYLNF